MKVFQSARYAFRVFFALAEAATPAPWWNESGVVHCRAACSPDGAAHICGCRLDEANDGEFIADARTAVPRYARMLLAAIDGSAMPKGLCEDYAIGWQDAIQTIRAAIERAGEGSET